MKKIAILLTLVFAVTVSQAQIGGALGKKLKEKAGEVVGNAIGGKNQQNQDNNKNTNLDVAPNDNDEITPDQVIAMVPTMPNPQQMAEYLCESHRANPRTLKMVTNPTTIYLTQLAGAGMGGYATLASQGGYGRYFAFDEQLLKEFGITQEQYDAMSEEDQQALALKYAAEMEDRYYKTIERLAKDDGYQKLMDEYNALESKIEKIYSDADSVCQDRWQKKYGNDAEPNEESMCGYFREMVPVYYQAVVQGMKTRKTEQMALAKRIDAYVQTLAVRYPNEVYAGLYSQQSVCAISYVTDAARVTSMSDPR